MSERFFKDRPLARAILLQVNWMIFRPNQYKRKTNHKYLARLTQAFWCQLHHKVGGGCKDLVSTTDLLKQANISQRRDLGIRQVPIKQIVGSGRWRDFDLTFRPKRQDLDGRWQRQAAARLRGSPLAPVQLLKIAGRYFVVDGNHRISVARAVGQSEIKAKVMELEITNLQQKPDCQRLGFRLIPQKDNLTTNNC